MNRFEELARLKEINAPGKELQYMSAELVAELDVANRYIRELESKKNQEGLMWACDELNGKIDKQRSALKKLGEMVRSRGRAIRGTLDSLESIECQFSPCPGPDEPFVDMLTCHRCSAIQQLKGVIR